MTWRLFTSDQGMPLVKSALVLEYTQLLDLALKNSGDIVCWLVILQIYRVPKPNGRVDYKHFVNELQSRPAIGNILTLFISWV